MSAFNPDYPNPAAVAYRDAFLAGMEACRMGAPPDNVLSWAIDRAIAAGSPADRAGWVFAATYRRPMERQRLQRNAPDRFVPYLLAVFEKDLGGKV